MKEHPDAPARRRTSVLADLASDVRHDTIRLLQGARQEELTWTPPGMSNHILWHAGHALWVQDALCVRLITGASELPGGWEGLFGMGSRPANQPAPWPSRNDLLARLHDQHLRLLELFRTLPDLALDSPPPFPHQGDPRTLGQSALHASHDEAKHQGEMYFLLKMQRLAPGRS